MLLCETAQVNCHFVTTATHLATTHHTVRLNQTHNHNLLFAPNNNKLSGHHPATSLPPIDRQIITQATTSPADQNHHQTAYVFDITTPGFVQNLHAPFITFVDNAKNQDTLSPNACFSPAPHLDHDLTLFQQDPNMYVNIKDTTTPVNNKGTSVNTKNTTTPVNIKVVTTHENIKVTMTPVNIKVATTPINIKVTTTAVNINNTNTPPNIKDTEHNFTPLPKQATTPINIDKFRNCLDSHPDHHLVDYLVNGLSYGFDIGFSAEPTVTRPRNLLSATEHTSAVTEALMKEVARGHTAGPFTSAPLPNLHCSPLGSRGKKDGGRHLIMDLSQPRGMSINEGIDKEHFPVKYTHFDEATRMVQETDTQCLKSKIDIQHAFRLLPVKPAQWILLGICWLSQIFIDMRLPFGLRSSPAIFNKLADAICWIICKECIHPHQCPHRNG